MSLKMKKSELIFLIAVIICSINKFNGEQVSIYLQNTVALIWILYSLTIRKFRENKIVSTFHLKYAVIPIVAMMVYTVVVWMIFPVSGTGTGLSYFTRMLSTNTYLILQLLFACTAFNVFGSRTIDLIWNGMAINYVILSIIPALIFGRGQDILSYLLLSGDITSANSYLEVHDITFAFGILFIYYFVIEFGKRTKRNFWRLISTMIFIYLGYKRVEIFAIILLLLYYYIIDIRFKNMRNKTRLMTMVVLALSLLFVWSIYSGAMAYIALKYNIEFNYRLDTWNFWANKSSFDLSFPGLGLNYVDKETYLLHQQNGLLNNGYIVLSGMHSDLYKKYIELGFISFCIWIVYMVGIRTKKLNKKFGKYAADIYLLVTLYIFVLYLTDNVYNYFMTNVCYLIAPMTMCLAKGVIQDFRAKKIETLTTSIDKAT